MYTRFITISQKKNSKIISDLGFKRLRSRPWFSNPPVAETSASCTPKRKWGGFPSCWKKLHPSISASKWDNWRTTYHIRHHHHTIYGIFNKNKGTYYLVTHKAALNTLHEMYNKKAFVCCCSNHLFYSSIHKPCFC